MLAVLIADLLEVDYNYYCIDLLHFCVKILRSERHQSTG